MKDLVFCYRTEVKASSLMGLLTTELALFLIKEKEVFFCCDSTLTLQVLQMLHQVAESSEREKERVSTLTFYSMHNFSEPVLICQAPWLTVVVSLKFSNQLDVQVALISWLHILIIFFLCVFSETNQAIQFSGFQNGTQKNSLGFPSLPSAVVELQQVKCHSEISVLLVEQWTPHQPLPFL